MSRPVLSREAGAVSFCASLGPLWPCALVQAERAEKGFHTGVAWARVEIRCLSFVN